MTTPHLTATQLQTLQYIAAYQRQNGYAPTIEELGKAFGRGKITMYNRVRSLVPKGCLKLDPPKGARNIVVTPTGQALCTPPRLAVPLGTIGMYLEFPEGRKFESFAYVPPSIAAIPALHVTTKAERI